MVEAVRPSTVPYFYGRISRDEAEQILQEQGSKQGLYLLRENMTVAGNYALSICHQGRVHHYSIERQQDGSVMIQDGQKFLGPVELIRHHGHILDGFLTKPAIACNRRQDQLPMAWPSVTYLELEQALYDEAERRKLKGKELENALGPQRALFVAQVAKDLHKDMPWFHPNINREQADRIMQKQQHQDGKFLVREREDRNVVSYALSLSHRGQTKHYKIEKIRTPDGDKFAIEDGPKFACLMDMVSHYYNKTDGLLCKLSSFCVRENYVKPVRGNNLWKNGIYGQFREDAWEEPESNNDVMNGAFGGEAEFPLPVSGGGGLHRGSSLAGQFNNMAVSEDPQEVYDKLPRSDDIFNLKHNDLELRNELGGGNFGSVRMGVYKHDSKTIPVAVKTLKQTEQQNAAAEMLKEARLMADLKHRHIVRLIGTCKSGQTIMLVMELAGLGPVNKYLKAHREMTIANILELMFQVAQGMEYLESRNFVHRDLAARNVLLVTETFAKISDFGMSKALGLENEYYKAETAGKWPLKWYAPECIYFWKFDSKSDVWSYGVTLWEALSYGAKPYRGQHGTQILQFIDEGGRLPCPDRCPDSVYRIMTSCWEYNKADRPSFKVIVESMRKAIYPAR